jgi:hypothetical protein
MNENLYLSLRVAQLKREDSRREADRWRLANPGSRRRRWPMPHLDLRPGRLAGLLRARSVQGSGDEPAPTIQRSRPQEQCC